MNLEPIQPDAAARKKARAAWFGPVLALAVLLSFPYSFSLGTFFSHDDFLILHFHKDWPAWTPWVFFRTEVLAFYRPLQSYVFALLFQLFDVNPFPYGALLVLIHLGCVVLFGCLVQRLFENRPLTLLAVLFYAVNWEYCDVVFWKANFGTSLSWLFSLGAANAFVSYLRTRRTPPYVALVALLFAALFSKETAVNVPLLLSLVYCVEALGFGRSRGTGDTDSAEKEAARPGMPIDWNARAWEFVRVLGPLFFLIAAYLVFHRLTVRDVHVWPDKGYRYASAFGAFESVARGVTFWFTFFLRTDVPPQAPARAQSFVVHWLDRLSFIVPVILVAIAVALRSWRIVFGVLWAVLAFAPANLLEVSDISRYYYGAITGIAVVWAEVFVAVDQAVARRASRALVAGVRMAGAVVVAVILYTNLAFTTDLVLDDARKCRRIRRVYDYLVTLRGTVPEKTLFRVHCLNGVDHFNEGLGLREMFKLALRDDTVEAILPDQKLADETLDLLLREYGPPVELFQSAPGEFRMVVAQPTTPTAATLPSPAPREADR